MYFEDIYNNIYTYWKKSFSLKGIEQTETYVLSIKKNYNEVEFVIDHKFQDKFSEWESMLVFTMYQALTSHTIKRWNRNKSIKEIHFSEIPITTFEKYFRENLEPEDECEGNPEYLKQYKGLKNPV